MKKLISIAILSSLTSIAGDNSRRVPLHGAWNPDNYIHFAARDNTLVVGKSYTIVNNTFEVVYIMLTSNNTPLDFGLCMSGESVEFASSGDSIDLFTYPAAGNNLNGKNGIQIYEAN